MESGTHDQKVVIVTGASQGIGRGIAQGFHESGWMVVGVDVRTVGEPGLPGLPDGSAIDMQMADVRVQEQLTSAVDYTVSTYGRIDACVASAGVFSSGPLWEMSENDWNRTIDINLSGVWRTIKAVAPEMIKQHSGSIILVGSVSGVEAGAPFAAYVSSKHGVTGLMRAAALELSAYGVRVNAILPGNSETPMNNTQEFYDLAAGHAGGTREDALRLARRFHALEGAGQIPTRAHADAALWLAGDGSQFVTGAAVPVDAGHLLLTGMNPSAD